jgi:hypothetical protein
MLRTYQYVEVYEPRAGFVYPHDRYGTLGPLDEIASKAAQRVTRSQDGISQHELTRSNEVWRYR